MKKIIAISILCLCAAQNTNAQNWLKAGNSITASDFLGSTNDVPLILKVNNNVAGRIEGPSGNDNTIIGYQALNAGTGSSNSAMGVNAIKANTTGSYNSIVGYDALVANTTGMANSAIGYYALYNQVTGSNNTGIGFGAYPTSSTGLINWSGLGYNVGSAASAGNMVELGNTSITSIRQQVASTIVSDARIKDNVKANVPGLDFINRLRPVTYNLNIHHQNEMIYKGKEAAQAEWDGKYDIEKMKISGFIAQEVEAAAKDAGYEFSGVDKPATPEGLYGIRYSDFVMPLVKSVQELSAANEILKKQNEEIQAKYNNLESKVMEMSKALTSCCSSYEPTAIDPVQHTNNTATPALEQNFPNPFSDKTTIRCFVPNAFHVAAIKVFSATGSEVLTFPVLQKGTTNFTISGNTLAAGVYQYSLLIDGTKTDTRTMVLTR